MIWQNTYCEGAIFQADPASGAVSAVVAKPAAETGNDVIDATTKR